VAAAADLGSLMCMCRIAGGGGLGKETRYISQATSWIAMCFHCGLVGTGGWGIYSTLHGNKT